MSSQDVGVGQATDVAVAKTILDVGYNDPDVGAVMQHKAPRDWAAFLQRKGRAGRPRTMRPWTVVVLSDFGRDRIAYQAYDQLFDPELPLRSLPVANRYVLRMQAAFALMDWVAREMPPAAPAGSVWTDFSGPAQGWHAETIRKRQEFARQILSEVLDGNDARFRSLEKYLESALRLSPEETQSVLWDAPRPILTVVIPTLLRRLETGWRRVLPHPGESARDYQIKDHPLPDFVPQQLFGDLNLPEVEIAIDPQQHGLEPESFFMPLLQALRTLAPGRVTRRFGYRHAYAYHWAPPTDLATSSQNLAVEDYCAEFEEAGSFQVREGDGIREMRCVRPWRIHPRRPPANAAITSNAQLQWRSQLAPAREDDRLCFAPPRGSAWAPILNEARFYTHGERNHVVVRRFAVASRASLSFRDGSAADLDIRFVEKESKRRAAVGFEQQVDGIAFRFQVPRDLGLSPTHPNQRKLRAFRTAYFRERVQCDPDLATVANGFQREWLAQIYLSALISRARQDGLTAEQAQAQLKARGIVGAMAEVLGVIFQSIELPGGGQANQKVHDTMLHLFGTPGVAETLERHAPVLWQPPDADALRWAAIRYQATLGGALLEACQQTCSQMEAGDLYLDLDAGPRPPGTPPAPDGQ